MKHLAVFVCIAGLFCMVFLSCATSSGSLFSTMMTETDADTEEETDVKQSPPETGVRIVTEPEKADVYLNKEYAGITPVTVTDLKPGSYALELRREGFKTLTSVVEIRKNIVLEFNVELNPITGFISVTAHPANAIISLGDTALVEPIQETPAGRHTLLVRAFGFEPYEEMVEIEENLTTLRSVVLNPADFAVSEFKPVRSRFNPENPGGLGKTRISFMVTASGAGTLYVYNENDEAITDIELPSFTTWEQSVQWDGKDGEGKKLPDGAYSIALTALGVDGIEVTRETTVIIDRTQSLAFRGLFHGSSGLLYAQTTEMLPQDMMQISFLVLGHVESVNGILEARFPAVLGLRFSVLNLLDCALSISAIPQTMNPVPYSAGGSLRYRFLKTPGAASFNMAAALRATFQRGETFDSLTNYGAVYAGFPLQVSAGPFGVSLTPELAFSTKRISYIPEEVYPEQTLYVWGYGRFGMFLDFGGIGTGLSYALRLKPFSEGFGVQFPMSAGLEFWFFIPNTQAAIHAALAGEFGDTGFYLMGGFGLGFFN